MRANRIRAHYEPRIHPHRAASDILEWSSPEAQRARFEVFFDVLCREGLAIPARPAAEAPRGNGTRRVASATDDGAGGMTTVREQIGEWRLLDVGCGLTDLHCFLRQRHTPMQYVGVDISFLMLQEALRRHPGRLVLQADIFAQSPFPPETFDVVFCSGTLNLHLDNNEQFAEFALHCLAKLARRCTVVNFLHHRAPFRYPECHYYDPGQICAAVLQTGCTVQLIEGYLPNDFTVVMRP